MTLKPAPTPLKCSKATSPRHRLSPKGCASYRKSVECSRCKASFRRIRTQSSLSSRTPEIKEAIEKLVPELFDAARGVDSPAAVQARRLASILAVLAKAPQASLDEAQRILIAPLE